MKPKGIGGSAGSLILAIVLLTAIAAALLSQVLMLAFEMRTTVSAGLASPFELRINQTAIIDAGNDEIKITLLDVIEDSRCPGDSMSLAVRDTSCKKVAGGNGVAIQVGIQKNGEDLGKFRLTTKPDDMDSALATFDEDGHYVRLEALEPAPEGGFKTDPLDYVATLIASTRTGRGERIYFETISRGSYSGQEESSNYIIRNQDNLEQLLAKAQLPPVSGVDFSKDTLLAAFSGKQPTGGYGVEIAEMYEFSNYFTALVQETYPGRGCVVTQLPSQPFHIIKIPLSGKEVVFKTVEEPEICD